MCQKLKDGRRKGADQAPGPEAAHPIEDAVEAEVETATDEVPIAEVVPEKETAAIAIDEENIRSVSPTPKMLRSFCNLEVKRGTDLYTQHIDSAKQVRSGNRVCKYILLQ